MSFKILFKYPTRSRPSRFFEGMDSIVNNLTDKHNYHILVTADEDDETMNNEEVRKRIEGYENTTVIFGHSVSKVHAINRDMDIEGEWNDFKILVCMSDDMRFNYFGFDDMIRVHMNAVFPNFDGLLHYPDTDAKHMLATVYIAGRPFYDRFGHIYHPSYKSLFCDNEVQEIAQQLGLYHYAGINIVFHEHPSYGHVTFDEQYTRQQALWGVDEANFIERKAHNFYLS